MNHAAQESSWSRTCIVKSSHPHVDLYQPALAPPYSCTSPVVTTTLRARNGSPSAVRMPAQRRSVPLPSKRISSTDLDKIWWKWGSQGWRSGLWEISGKDLSIIWRLSPPFTPWVCSKWCMAFLYSIRSHWARGARTAAPVMTTNRTNKIDRFKLKMDLSRL